MKHADRFRDGAARLAADAGVDATPGNIRVLEEVIRACWRSGPILFGRDEFDCSEDALGGAR